MTTELFSVWFLVKILFVTAFLVYVAFAGLVVRQVYLMTQTLEVGLETSLRTFSWAHLTLAISVLALAVIFL